MNAVHVVVQCYSLFGIFFWLHKFDLKKSLIISICIGKQK